MIYRKNIILFIVAFSLVLANVCLGRDVLRKQEIYLNNGIPIEGTYRLRLGEETGDTFFARLEVLGYQVGYTRPYEWIGDRWIKIRNQLTVTIQYVDNYPFALGSITVKEPAVKITIESDVEYPTLDGSGYNPFNKDEVLLKYTLRSSNKFREPWVKLHFDIPDDIPDSAFASDDQPVISLQRSIPVPGESNVALQMILLDDNGLVSYRLNGSFVRLSGQKFFKGVFPVVFTGPDPFDVTVQATDTRNQTTTRRLSIERTPGDPSTPTPDICNRIRSEAYGPYYSLTPLLAPGANSLHVNSAYHYREKHDGLLGKGRCFSYDAQMIYCTDGTSYYRWIRLPDGTRLEFKEEQEVYVPTHHTQSKLLTSAGSDEYVLLHKDKKYHFDGEGRCFSIDEAKQTVFIDHSEDGKISKITDTDDCVLTFAYAGKKVNNVTDQGGRKLSFMYDVGVLGTTLLKAFAVDDTVRESYLYDDSERLKNISDTFGTEHISYLYDKSGQLIGSRENDLERVYSFDVNTNKHVEIDSLGRKTEVVLNEAMQPTKTTYSNGGVEQFFYDPETKDISSIVDVNGNYKEFSYDENGNVSSVQDSDGTSIAFGWIDINGHQRQEYSIGRNGGGTYYSYNHNGFTTSVVSADGAMREYEYIDGKLTASKNSRGKITNYEYSSGGRLERIINPNGGVSAFSYDQVGNLVEQIDPRGFKITRKFNSNRKLIEETVSPDGVAKYIRKFIYDNAGNLTEEVSANGAKTLHSYDKYNRRTKTILPSGVEYSYAYDIGNRLIGKIDTLGNKYEYEYNSMNNVIREKNNGVIIATKDYDLKGKLIKEADCRGDHIWEYGEHGRLDREVLPNGTEKFYSYNKSGAIESVSISNQGVIEFSYDAFGREVSRTYQGGGSVHNVRKYFDGEGNLIRTNDNLQQIDYEYDDNNRRIRANDSSGRETRWEYDEAGNISNVVTPNGASWKYTYDGVGRVLSEKSPLGEIKQYSYDLPNKSVKVVNENGESIVYSYDIAQRLLSIIENSTVETRMEYKDNTSVEIWDRTGKITESYRMGHHVKTDYDQLQSTVVRLLDVQGNFCGFKIENEATGQIYGYTTERFGDEVLCQYFDGNIAKARYLPGGDLGAVSYPNGIIGTYSYDELARLVGLKYTLGAETIAEYRCSYNNVGNVSQLICNERTAWYEYDALDRLVRMHDSEGFDVGYRYDSMGNRLSSITSSGTTTYSYDLAGKLLSSSGEKVVSYKYDKCGRLIERTQDTEATRFGWTPQGKLERVVLPNNDIVEYRYHPTSGLCISRAVNGIDNEKYIWVNGKLVQTLDSNNRLSRGYIAAGNEDAIAFTNGTASFSLLKDPFGNIAYVVSEDGSILNNYSYAPYGNLITEEESLTNCLRFSSKIYDKETGLYFFNDRWYDPDAGRFISPDPTPAKLSEGVYTFAMSNPTKYSDPSGLFVEFRGPHRTYYGNIYRTKIMTWANSPWWFKVFDNSCHKYSIKINRGDDSLFYYGGPNHTGRAKSHPIMLAKSWYEKLASKNEGYGIIMGETQKGTGSSKGVIYGEINMYPGSKRAEEIILDYFPGTFIVGRPLKRYKNIDSWSQSVLFHEMCHVMHYKYLERGQELITHPDIYKYQDRLDKEHELLWEH